ncbi:hypothetical protein [Corynebacterium aquilae]|nr:hypothetical protein [Corynebacterium aquilae]
MSPHLLPLHPDRARTSLPRLVARGQHPTQPESRHSAAQVALSHSLATQLHTADGPITWDQLRHLPGSTISWWNRSAENLLRTASSGDVPYQFIALRGVLPRRERHSHTPAANPPKFFEVHTTEALQASSWLSHPACFQLLHDAATQRLKHAPFFLPLASGQLLVASTPNQRLLHAAAEAVGDSPLTAGPVQCHHGFPVVVGQDRVPPVRGIHPTLRGPMAHANAA